jgi:hypothetical protein
LLSSLNAPSLYDRRYSHGGRPRGHIAEDDSVRANFGVIADGDPAQHLGPGSDVDVPCDARHPSAVSSRAYGHLLKNQAIGANFSVGMNDHAVGMGEQQASAEPHRERYFDPRYDGPKSMACDGRATKHARQRVVSLAKRLVIANRPDDLTTRLKGPGVDCFA